MEDAYRFDPIQGYVWEADYKRYMESVGETSWEISNQNKAQEVEFLTHVDKLISDMDGIQSRQNEPKSSKYTTSISLEEVKNRLKARQEAQALIKPKGTILNIGHVLHLF